MRVESFLQTTSFCAGQRFLKVSQSNAAGNCELFLTMTI